MSKFSASIAIFDQLLDSMIYLVDLLVNLLIAIGHRPLLHLLFLLDPLLFQHVHLFFDLLHSFLYIGEVKRENIPDVDAWTMLPRLLVLCKLFTYQSKNN